LTSIIPKIYIAATMHLQLTAEQRAFQAMARQVCAALAVDFDPQVLVETGLIGLRLPEHVGGSGATAIEGVLFAEELGRALVPGHVMASALVTPAALRLMDDEGEAVAAEIAAGRPATVAVTGELGWPPHSSGLAWGWHPDSIVLVPDGTRLTPSDGVLTEGFVSADLGLNLARVPCGDADPLPVESAQWFLAETNVVLAGALLGHMEAALDLSVAYAAEREQFGVKIGSFQAVKHLCADMYVDVEASRSIAYGAAAMLHESVDVAEAGRTAAIAKAWCADAAVRVVEGAIQIHGGLGFTWDIPLHRHLRAVHVARASFMSVDVALELIAEAESWN
jgi:alkylation response protein AidB-like acyl-CoA dehydrogenase